jgi:hypothetical protein
LAAQSIFSQALHWRQDCQRASHLPLLLSVPLELPQQAVAALDGVIQCTLRILLAGEGRFEILGDDVADLHQIAETQPARILGWRKRSAGAPTQFENALAVLAARRAELDDYSTAIGRPAGRTGFTVADLLFESGRVRVDHPVLTRKIDGAGLSDQVGVLADTLSIDRYSDDETIRGLKQAAQAVHDLSPFGGPAACPWRGVQAQSLAIDPRAAQQSLADWRDRAMAATQAIADLNVECGLALVALLSTIKGLRELAVCPLDLPAIFALTVEIQTVFDELSRDFGLPLRSNLRGLLQATRILNLMNSAPEEALAYGHEGLDSSGAAAALKRLTQILKRRADFVISLQGRIERPDVDGLDEQGLRAAGKLLNEAGLFTRIGKDWREARRLGRALSPLGASKRPKDQGEALLILAERVAIDLELENDAEIRAACGVHFRGAATNVANLSRALHWRRAVHAEFGDRRERQLRDLLLRALPNDISDIKERTSGPVAELTARVSEVLNGEKHQPEADLWGAIACSVASGALADALASRKSTPSVADFMLLVRRAATAGRAWEEAQRSALDGLSIDLAAWFGSADEGDRRSR